MKINLCFVRWLTITTLLIFNLQPATVFAQGTAFTYQGRLQNNGSPASGTYNLTFSLFNTNTSGVPIAGPVTNNAVNITNGLFTVMIDLGPGAFTGATNWLEIAVETNGVNTFTTLAPREKLTPVPYAIYAEGAGGLSGTLSASQLTSIGNTNGGFLNFFIGSSGNSTTSGSFNTADGSGALFSNTSGSGNTAHGYGALVGNTSGNFNTANGAQALVSGTSGSGNTANGYSALYNNTSGSYNIALGFQAGLNLTTGSSNIDIGNAGLSTDTNIIRIGSGESQTFIAGVINGNGGGLTNLSVPAASLTGTVPLAQLPAAVVTNGAGGVNISGNISGNGSGLTNLINVSAAQLTSIGNTSGGSYNFFVGQSGNSMTSGSFNLAIGMSALHYNTSGSYNLANGFQALGANTSGSFNIANGVDALASNATGSDNTANGFGALNDNLSGSDNTADGYLALHGTTGSDNIALGSYGGANITTGSSNIDIGNFGNSTDTGIIRIGSGQSQTFIAGVITGDGSGLTDLNASQLASIGNTHGGSDNFFLGSAGNSTMSGGENIAVGVAALRNNTSGYENTAIGIENLANNTSGINNAAYGAYALYFNTSGSGNIALGPSAGFYITTGGNNIDIGNQGFSTDTNIIRIGTSQTATYLVGNVYTPSGTVQSSSDRNLKENFAPINPRTMLDKVAALPVSRWNFKRDQVSVQHVGPMAQDFQAAFGLNGADDKHISVVDEGGVALAAIQGLNQKLEEKDAEIQTLNQQNDSLAERLNKLEATVKQLTANK